MRRTQLYLEDEMWTLLQILARRSKSSVSDLVRQAVREKYSHSASRRQIFQSVVGIWKDRDDLPDTETYIRRLRRGSRSERLLR